MLSLLRRYIYVRAAMALVVAYVLALQMLLAGAVSAQMAASQSADSFVICYGNGQTADGERGQPAKHVAHVTCAICSLASSTPPLSEAPTAPAFNSAATSIVAGNAVAAFAPVARHNPRTSQGPPKTA